jgi:DNA-binding MarR family transcriptional regulator
MSQDGLDPVIHAPARLRLMVTLAALPGSGSDALSFTRLQDVLSLTPGNLITHLRKLEDAGYVKSDKTGSGTSAQTTVTLTHEGRAALDRYTTVLRQLIDPATPAQQPTGPASPAMDPPPST